MKGMTISSLTVPFCNILQGLAKQKKIKVYLVGGFLRNFLLGRDCRDFDFAVSKDAIGLARLFGKKIKGAFVLLDQEHGCARIVKRQNGKIFTFDFADFRDKNLKQDLRHRDFTINTLCSDILRLNENPKLIHSVLIDGKKALKDLEQKRIQAVSKKSFKEDPLRLLRAFSLRSQLNFDVEKKTLLQIKKDRDSVRQAAYERIRDEFFKILLTPRASENIRLMDKIGLLEEIIPQITVMYRVKQGDYHHLDVWPHSLQVLEELEAVVEEFGMDPYIFDYLNESLAGERSRLGVLKLAALLHDIGKPQTKKIENGKTSFHSHEHVGKAIVRHIARLLKLSTRERYCLEDTVLWHLRPGYLSNFKDPSERAIFRYFRDTKEEALSILILSLADQRSTRGPLTTEHDQKHHEKIVRDLIARYIQKRQEKPFIRLINGNDLIKALKLKPSPLFGKILNEIEEKQVLGKILTKPEALKLAREIAKQEKKKKTDEN